MTREETLAIMSVLKAAYPSFYKDMKRSEAESVVNLWTSMFSDEPAELVAAAVKAHIATDDKGFPPHIGAIKAAITKIREPEEMTELEAWALVEKACRDGKYGSVEAFNALPEICRRLVGSPNQIREWAQMDAEVVSSVIASNFQRSYRARAKYEREQMALPADVKALMAKIAVGTAMPELPTTDEAEFEALREQQLRLLEESLSSAERRDCGNG